MITLFVKKISPQTDKRNRSVDENLVNRYKNELGIPEDIKITEKMVYGHLDLEIKLAEKLRRSPRNKRWDIAKRCYTDFYTQLSWLPKYAGTSLKIPIEIKENAIINIIGKSPKNIYEIGSGSGELLFFLAESGHQCRGCDLYEKRGLQEKFTHPHFTRSISDGVHLDRFEPTDMYDIVISNNVFEHLHPDDAMDHIKSVHRILKNEGQYILKTPHQFYGPHGIEKIFGFDKSIGFHLKEYTFTEIFRMARKTGYQSIGAIFIIPAPLKYIITKSLFFKYYSIYGKFFIRYLVFLENIYQFGKNIRCRQILRQCFRYIFFPRQVFVVLKK